MIKQFIKISALLLTAAIMALFTSCENEEIKVVPKLTVFPSTADIVFSASGTNATSSGTRFDPTFKVYTNQEPWDAVSNQSWLTVSKQDKSFKLIAAQNTSVDIAAATVTITAGDAEPTIIHVTQNGYFPVTGISVSPESLDLQEGQSSTLAATFLPQNHGEDDEDNTIIWESSNTSIATVTNGVVQTVGRGYAVISATLKRNPSIKKEIPIGVYRLLERTNIALNKPVTTSSDQSAVYVGAKAVDGDKDVESRWGSVTNNNIPHWIAIDLQGSFTISALELTLYTVTGSSGTECMKEFYLQAWSDIANDWYNIYEEYDQPKRGIGVQYYAEFNAITTKKVRWYVPDYFMNKVRLIEIEVYNDTKIYN